MKFIRPTKITDAMLTSSTVPETDHAEWAAGTNYTVGDKCIRTSTHRIYERLIGGTTATPPESDATNWLDLGPTNRWALFDEKVGTVTTAANSMTYVLQAGRIDSLALLNADAASVTVSLVVDSVEVYSASLDLIDNTSVGNWYQYFYEPFYRKEAVVLTGLLDAALVDVPPYGEGTLTITFTRTGGTVSCGMLVVGLLTEVGTTLTDVQVSIRDYSRKERDAFGNATIVERDYSRVMSAPVLIEGNRARVDFVVKELARYRATPVVIIGSETYGSTVFFGWFADWKVTLKNELGCTVTVECEGMT